MALDLRQNIKMSQQLLMTPQLQQAIKLLQLSRFELEQFVEQQLSENPILDEDQSDSTEPIERDDVEATSEDFMSDSLKEAYQIVDEVSSDNHNEIDWENLSRLQEASSQNSSTKNTSFEEESPNYEQYVSSQKKLSEYLYDQVSEGPLSEEEKQAAILIIGNINEKGYLEGSLEEMATTEEYDLEFLEGVLDTIQRMDPPGVAARNIQECLLIQLREKKLKNGVVEKIVQNHMHDLEIRNYAAVAKALKISINDVLLQTAIIAQLDPIPARQFGENMAHPVIPDVYVYQIGGKWVVSLNEDGLPRLRVNDYYRSVAGDLGKGESKEYIVDKIRSANWLIKSIQQRQKTIFRVTQKIVERQVEFFEQGVQFLKPMVLKDIAEEIEMHESTISRVTTNKYVHTPRGVFELKYFFNSGVSQNDGTDMASESVKALIRDIVSKENAKKPYSDQKIVAMLEDKGIQVARRTIAKYREQIGILPSSQRKKLF